MKKIVSVFLSMVLLLEILSVTVINVSATTVMNSSEFVNKLVDVAKNYKTLYVMGSFGSPMTESRKSYFINTHHCDYNNKSDRVAMINAATSDTFGFDCVCLIKGILWGWNGDTSKTNGGAVYGSNNVPDIGANDIINVCSEVSTTFNHSTMSPGELVWMSGHVGIYIGDGLTVECSPKWKNGVQITACNKTVSGYNRRDWTKHGKLPYIDYSNPSNYQPKGTVNTDEIMSEVASTYAAIRKTRGTTYQGWCGRFVADQLNYMGIGYVKVSSNSSLNGNQWYSSLSSNAVTTHGYKQVKYSGNNCLNNIVSEKGSVVYNVVISFKHQYGYSDSNPGAGHVVLIHAIVDGYVYFCECYSSGSRAEGQPQKRTISAFMSAYNNSYGSAIGAIHFEGNYSTSQTTISNNPDDYPEPTRNIGYYNNVASTGNDVKWVQAVLSQLGYSITIDGSFGPASKEVVIDFQGDNDLTQDGSVGPATREKLKEKWVQFKNRNSYSFNFNPSGGTMGSDVVFSVGYGQDFYVENTTCTKYGYYFGGWNVKRNNDNKWYVAGVGWCSESTISSNGYSKKNYPNYVTLTLDDSWINGISGDGSYTFYATWLPNTINISYSANGGSGSMSGASYKTGNSFTVPACGFTRSGYTFNGWILYRSNDSKYATVSNGWLTSSEISSQGATYQRIQPGETYTLDYSWSDGYNDSPVNITLAANWSVNPVNVSIHTAGGVRNGSTESVYTNYVPGTKINLGTPTKEGYNFLGWTIDYAGGGHVVEPWGSPLYSDPVFANSNTGNLGVYNNSGNGTVSVERVTKTSDCPTYGTGSMLKVTTAGSASPGLGGFYQGTYSKANGVFYHIIIAKIPKGYTIARASNSCGTGAEYTWLTSQEGTGEFKTYIYKTACGSSGTFDTFGHVYIYGNEVTSSNPVTWYVGYTEIFDATGLSSSGTNYTVGNGTGILWPMWERQTFTVSYNANGGTEAPGYQTKNYGSNLILSTAIPKKSYTVNYNANEGTVSAENKSVDCTFDYWKCSYNASAYYPGDTYSINANTTMIAQWIDPVVGELPAPARSGYAFTGWYTGISGGTQVTASTVVTGNMTLYAHWDYLYNNSIDLYAYGFENNEGNNSENNALLLETSNFYRCEGEEYSLSADLCPTTIPTGYELTQQVKSDVYDNMNKEEVSGPVGPEPGPSPQQYEIHGNLQSIDIGTVIIQPAREVYIEFSCEPIEYAISYDLNGGTNSANNPSVYTVLYGVTFEDPTREGYTFAGWTDENGNSITGINPGADAWFDSADDFYCELELRTTGNITVYAQWTPNAKLGDVNGDGEITDIDRIYLTYYLAGWEDYTEQNCNLTAADVNSDGKVNNLDRLILTRYLAGWNEYSELLGI